MLPMSERNITVNSSDRERHALVGFWQNAFAPFAQRSGAGLSFSVPGFADPLLSPNFVIGNRAEVLAAHGSSLSHFNEILPLGVGQRELPSGQFSLALNFFLGQRELRDSRLILPKSLYSAEIRSLELALRGNQLPRLLKAGFPESAAFLAKLLPFLTTLPAHFETGFLLAGDEVLGVVSVGCAGEFGLCLNAVIDHKYRGLGLSGELAALAEKMALSRGVRQLTFWTQHPPLLRFADQVHHYQIFTRREGY